MKVHEMAPLRFFLGANTPSGFVSRMDQLTDPLRFDRVFILKGGPGSGKSTLLTRIAQAFVQAGKRPELIRCSFDPDSLDAVTCGRVAVIDGTAPHAIEPQYPGAMETIVPLSECWDARPLFAQRESIIRLVDSKRQLCEQSCRYLSAAEALLSDTYRLALEATDTAKITRLAARIALTELRGGAGSGIETIRLLSAHTANGSVLYEDTAKRLANRIYLLEDDYGPSAALLLSELRRHALASRCDLLSCYSPLAPYERLDHLFIPALSVGFMTCNDCLSPHISPYRVINSRRFTDKSALAVRKKRIAFNKKAARQMFLQAQELLSEAGRVHRQLESIYTPTMNFSAVDALTERLIALLVATP